MAARTPGRHYNGAFHSDFRLARRRAQRRAPHARLLVVTAVPVKDLTVEALSEDRKRADYLLYVLAPVKADSTSRGQRDTSALRVCESSSPARSRLRCPVCGGGLCCCARSLDSDPGIPAYQLLYLAIDLAFRPLEPGDLATPRIHPQSPGGGGCHFDPGVLLKHLTWERTSRRSSSLRIAPNAGIALRPVVTTRVRESSLSLAMRVESERFAGRGVRPAAAGPSPLPFEPWHIAQ
jgi:hypothetical protein